MRRFRFRLASLARLARAEEALAKSELASRNGALDDAERARLTREAACERARAEVAAETAAEFDPGEALRRLAALEGAGELAERAAVLEREAAGDAERAREDLGARVTARKALTTLESRARDRHARESDRLEGNEADDHASRRRGERSR